MHECLQLQACSEFCVKHNSSFHFFVLIKPKPKDPFAPVWNSILNGLLGGCGQDYVVKNDFLRGIRFNGCFFVCIEA